MQVVSNPDTSSLFLGGAGTGVGLFGLGADIVGVELTRADGSAVPCEVRSGLALCAAGDPSGPLTLTAFDSAGGSTKQSVSLDDI